MTRAFDVVVVPDFMCEKASVFEGRTLFFLASWIENAGQARGFPLHLACIGEPPPSVRCLAAQANASITVHEPVRAERRGGSNKLRGLEVQGREDCLLLLDVDVLVLSDISDLSHMGHCIAAAPANRARVPERHWQKIYPALGIAPPTERIASIYGELDYPYMKKALSAPQKLELKHMFPKFNSGVLWLPWNCELRAIWEDHIRKIAALFDETDEEWKAVLSSDEAGLATAIELLKSRGVPFTRLPDAFHGREPHIAMGALRVSDIKLFHATRLCKSMALDAETIHQEPHRHRRRLLSRMLPEWYRANARRLKRRDIGLDLPPPAIEACILGDLLQRLYVRHVAPAWQRTRTSSRTRKVHQAEMSKAQKAIGPTPSEGRRLGVTNG